MKDLIGKSPLVSALEKLNLEPIKDLETAKEVFIVINKTKYSFDVAYCLDDFVLHQTTLRISHLGSDGLRYSEFYRGKTINDIDDCFIDYIMRYNLDINVDVNKDTNKIIYS